jgi:RNA polymerase sigma-70 factor, ECF subfamily
MGPSQRTSIQAAPLDRQRAFTLLFREKTYAAVWNWLRRLGVPRRDRLDIAQDVFLAGYQSFPTYDPLRARPERWLNRITVHVAAHYRERAHHRREEFTSEDEPGIADESPDAEQQMEAEQTRLLIMERLAELQPGERTILVEHDLEEVPMLTVAERYGIPLSTAYKWRARALLALRALMEERGHGDKPLPGSAARRVKKARAAACRKPPAPPRPPRPLPGPLPVVVGKAASAAQSVTFSAPACL